MVILLVLTSLFFVCNKVDSFDVIRYASVQYSILYQEFVDSRNKSYPWYGYPLEKDWVPAEGLASGWTEGFFPGVLWNLAEYNLTQESLQRAITVTLPTASFINVTDTADVGFVIMSGFGNGYRLLKNPDYMNFIVQGAHTLAKRYSSIVRCTCSWDSPEGYIVYIDNMMDLDILFVAANYTNNQTLYNIGWQHANRTMYEHFRENNSTYHVVLYNQTDGSVIRKYTSQGYANWSTWARGHSWGIYGFTTAYRYTKYQPFLDKAIGATNYVLTHLPSSSDLITYWDYDAPYNSTLPYQPRDTSAAAIFTSALVELAQYVPTSEMKDRFLSSARAIVDQLSTPKYLIYGNKNYQLPALLANGTIGPYPERPYDVALSFGDYYLTQAIVRLAKL